MTGKKKRGRPARKKVEAVQEIERESPVIDRQPETAKKVVDELLQASQDIDLSKLKLENFEDYKNYNIEARKQKKPVKFMPLSMFPLVKTKIIRNDGQKNNPLHVRIRDAEMLLDYDEELPIHKEIEIPYVVVNWLNNRAKKRYKQVKYPDGSSETIFSHNEPRFSCQMVM